MRKDELIAARYAKAFFDVAAERGEMERFGRELETCGQVLSGAGAEEFWRDPFVSYAKKRDVVTGALAQLEAPPGEECMRFMEVLLKNGRMHLVGEVVNSFRRMDDEKAGRVRVKVKTAKALSEEERTAIETGLGAREGRSVVLEVKEDGSLMAGLEVRVGDVVYDASAKGRLARLLRRLSVPVR